MPERLVLLFGGGSGELRVVQNILRKQFPSLECALEKCDKCQSQVRIPIPVMEYCLDCLRVEPWLPIESSCVPQDIGAN